MRSSSRRTAGLLLFLGVACLGLRSAQASTCLSSAQACHECCDKGDDARLLVDAGLPDCCRIVASETSAPLTASVAPPVDAYVAVVVLVTPLLPRQDAVAPVPACPRPPDIPIYLQKRCLLL